MVIQNHGVCPFFLSNYLVFKMNEEIKLQKAEQALLMFWHDYVRTYSPHARRYDPGVHTIAGRTMLYYFMTEVLIAYLDRCDIPGATGQALLLMHVSSGTLAEWRKRWLRTWLNLHLS